MTSGTGDIIPRAHIQDLQAAATDALAGMTIGWIIHSRSFPSSFLISKCWEYLLKMQERHLSLPIQAVCSNFPKNFKSILLLCCNIMKRELHPLDQRNRKVIHCFYPVVYHSSLSMPENTHAAG